MARAYNLVLYYVIFPEYSYLLISSNRKERFFHQQEYRPFFVDKNVESLLLFTETNLESYQVAAGDLPRDLCAVLCTCKLRVLCAGKVGLRR